jgi:hypothetical protein
MDAMQSEKGVQRFRAGNIEDSGPLISGSKISWEGQFETGP